MERVPGYILLALLIYWIYRIRKKKKAQKPKAAHHKMQADDEPLEIIETRVAGVTFENVGKKAGVAYGQKKQY